MPEKEVDRIKVVTGKGIIPSTGSADDVNTTGPKPRSRLSLQSPRTPEAASVTSALREPDQRSTDVIVFSDEASVITCLPVKPDFIDAMKTGIR